MPRAGTSGAFKTTALLVAALALSGCAAPQFKTFYLSQADWRGEELSGRGKIIVGDAVAGEAPATITILEIGALRGLPYDPNRRLSIQEARARTLANALERHGMAPADIALETRPADGSEREPQVLKPMVIVVHY